MQQANDTTGIWRCCQAFRCQTKRRGVLSDWDQLQLLLLFRNQVCSCKFRNVYLIHPLKMMGFHVEMDSFFKGAIFLWWTMFPFEDVRLAVDTSSLESLKLCHDPISNFLLDWTGIFYIQFHKDHWNLRISHCLFILDLVAGEVYKEPIGMEKWNDMRIYQVHSPKLIVEPKHEQK